MAMSKFRVYVTKERVVEASNAAEAAAGVSMQAHVYVQERIVAIVAQELKELSVPDVFVLPTEKIIR